MCHLQLWPYHNFLKNLYYTLNTRKNIETHNLGKPHEIWADMLPFSQIVFCLFRVWVYQQRGDNSFSWSEASTEIGGKGMKIFLDGEGKMEILNIFNFGRVLQYCDGLGGADAITSV